MNTYLYSSKNNAFFKSAELHLYKDWDLKDMINVDESVFFEFIKDRTKEGFIRISGDDGLPSWGSIPPPTQDEMIAQTIMEKASKIKAANTYMNEKQWPGKAVLGRLKDDEKLQYGLWLDYLDELEAVSTSTAPDVKWPSEPVL